MKKYLLRVLVGVIAFGIGLFGVWLLVFEIKFRNYCNQNLFSETGIFESATNPTEKIKVKFVGFGKKQNRPTLKFSVINQTSFSVNYSSELLVKFNGKEIQKRWNGACYFDKEGVLNSKESLFIEVFADEETFHYLNQKGSFEFGQSFYFSHLNYRWQIWSEPISISEKMKKDIIKNVPKLFKLETDRNKVFM